MSDDLELSASERKTFERARAQVKAMRYEATRLGGSRGALESLFVSHERHELRASEPKTVLKIERR